MLIALNLAALILVLGITWVGMIWLSGRVHPAQPEGRDTDRPTDAPQRDLMTGLPAHETRDNDARDNDECESCGGVGAETSSGRIVPCPACLGRGVSQS